MNKNLFIAASLAANAALLGYILLHAPAGSVPPPSPLNAQLPPAPTPAKPASTDFATAFKTEDPAALRDLLTASGFPQDLVHHIVRMRIWEACRARVNRISPEPVTANSWWKNDLQSELHLSPSQRAEIRRLHREAAAEELRILGPDSSDNLGHREQQLAFLPAEKRAQIQLIETDYADLRQEINDEMADFPVPADRVKLALLAEEEARDIRAVMSPDEQKAYDLRLSQTAENLRWEMTRLDVSESEYVQIFALQKAFDDKYAQNDPFRTGYDPDQPKPAWSPEERDKAEHALRRQIKALIGQDRYARAAKEQNYEYRQLQAAVRRFELPADTPDRIYSLRDTVSASARLIADHPSLSPENKKQELARLAAQTRDQVRSRLGTDIADAYFKNNGMGWLALLDEGSAVTFSGDDSGWDSYRPAASAPDSPDVPAIQANP